MGILGGGGKIVGHASVKNQCLSKIVQVLYSTVVRHFFWEKESTTSIHNYREIELTHDFLQNHRV